VTLSTVGYGDLSPSPTGPMRVFAAGYVLVGCGFVFPLLASLFEGVLTYYSETVCEAVACYITTCRDHIGMGNYVWSALP